VSALSTLDPETPPVAIVWWPEEAAAVERLRAARLPRLLLVAPGVAAPERVGPDEDWLRRPVDDDDVRARISGLVDRLSEAATAQLVVGSGRIRYRGRWVPLSDTEEALASTLGDRFGEVVGLTDLRKAGGRALSDGSVRVHVTRLRKRIAPIGLVVRVVRGHGYVLEDRHRIGRTAL
jgi:two-component system OmpR family response regulator